MARQESRQEQHLRNLGAHPDERADHQDVEPDIQIGRKTATIRVGWREGSPEEGHDQVSVLRT